MIVPYKNIADRENPIGFFYRFCATFYRPEISSSAIL